MAFADDCVGEAARKAVAALKDGDVLLLENTRFHAGEEKNDPAFVAELAKLGDIYVNDAFSAAHRAHASTEGLARMLPAYAGRAMQSELEALDRASRPRPARSSRSSAAPRSRRRSTFWKTSSRKVDALVIGGGMANTFLHAKGLEIGKSLAEKDLADDRPADHRNGRGRPAAPSSCRSTASAPHEFKAGRARTTPTASTRSRRTR